MPPEVMSGRPEAWARPSRPGGGPGGGVGAGGVAGGADGLAGATVLKGIAGFGHDRRVHTAAIEVVAEGLPVVVEAVDTRERIDRVLPKLEALMAGGVIMLERAHVIRYARTPDTTA